MQEINRLDRSDFSNGPNAGRAADHGEGLSARIAEIQQACLTTVPGASASLPAALAQPASIAMPAVMRYPQKIVEQALRKLGEYAVVMTSEHAGLLLYYRGNPSDNGYGLGLAEEHPIDQVAFERGPTGLYLAEGKTYSSLEALAKGLQHRHFMLGRPAPWSSLGSSGPARFAYRSIHTCAVQTTADLMGFEFSDAIVLGKIDQIKTMVNESPQLLEQSKKHCPAYFYALALAANQPEIAQYLVEQGMQINHSGNFLTLADAYELVFRHASLEQALPFLQGKPMSEPLLGRAMKGALANPAGGHGSALVNALVKRASSLSSLILVAIDAGLNSEQLKHYTEQPFWDLPRDCLARWLSQRPQDLECVLENSSQSAISNIVYDLRNNKAMHPSQIVPHLTPSDLPVLITSSGAYRYAMVEALRKKEGGGGMQAASDYLSQNAVYLWPYLSLSERKMLLRQMTAANSSNLLQAVVQFGQPNEVDAWLEVVSDPKEQRRALQSLGTSWLLPYRDSKAYHYLLAQQIKSENLDVDAIEQLLSYLFEVGADAPIKVALKAGARIRPSQAAKLFKQAMRAHAPQLVAVLASQGCINAKDADGKTLLELAVQENDETFISALLDAGATVQGLGKLLAIARRQHCLTTYKLLSIDKTMKGFASFAEEELQDELWACFLNSRLEDWLDYVATLPMHTDALKATILEHGALIARFPAPWQQEQMVESYGRPGIGYARQQKNFSQGRLQAYKNLWKAHLNGGVSLRSAYQVLSDSRSRKHYRAFRAFQEKMGDASTPLRRQDGGRRTRYDMFYPLAVKEHSKRLVERSNWDSDWYVVIDPTNKQRLSSIYAQRIFSPSMVWSHTRRATLLVLQDQLSRKFESIKSLKIDPTDTKSVDFLKNEIALFYSRASHAMVTNRGNAQYTLELHRFLYAIHGLEVAPPSREAVLPDCYALCSNPKEFASDYYEQCFAKFPETGSMVRLLANNTEK